MPFNYDLFNREERAICSHLFRLLHENFDKKWDSPIGLFLKKLQQRNPDSAFLKEITESNSFEDIGIFTEIALIRDYYESLKGQDTLYLFMDDLVKTIMSQMDISDCTLYSELDNSLNNPASTHPKQIRQKAQRKKIYLTPPEEKIYGSLQGMFNAKPDLAIVINGYLLTFEAKFTLPFKEEQLSRTRNISEIWSTLVYKELGFKVPPKYEVFTLGYGKYNPDISWQDVFDIAKITYPEDDRTHIALKSALTLLN